MLVKNVKKSMNCSWKGPYTVSEIIWHMNKLKCTLFIWIGAQGALLGYYGKCIFRVYIYVYQIAK